MSDDILEKTVLCKKGVVLGFSIDEDDEYLTIEEGPLENFSISKKYIDKVEEDKIILRDSIENLFLNKRVLDSNDDLLGHVNDVIIANDTLELVMVVSDEDPADTEKEGSGEYFIDPSWIERLKNDIHLKHSVSDIRFHNKDHTFRDKFIHLIKGHN